jgi:hypothetical protein
MRARPGHAIAHAALATVALAAGGPLPAMAGGPAAHGAPRPPEVIVRRVTTLDAHGHPAHVFRPGSTIQLRIQWTVRHAPSRTRQTTTWTVVYADQALVRVSKTAPARDGSWSRVTWVTVTRAPHAGAHIFWGRVAVAGVSSARSIAFTIRR